VAPAIEARELSKTFFVPVREPGLRAALRTLVARRTRAVHAVERISFEVEPGEVVGFLGPNGAGKTTALKLLSGLLHPTGGALRVAGFEPARRQREFLRHITLVMGQRNQLVWDLPAGDSFERNRAIYRLEAGAYRRARAELVELLDLGDLVSRPVRNLSLGERMRCELAAALLHRPGVLFLDEPTIGLDVTMQRRVREFVATYNQRSGATVLLSSHYMADVEALCRRVIVIHHGRILFDGELAALVDAFAAYRTLVLELADPALDASAYGEVTSREGGRVHLRVPKADAPKLTARILAELPVVDLVVEDPPVEDVIERVFAEGSRR
jgi:ABC-2 type transport system ATP-binding protein